MRSAKIKFLLRVHSCDSCEYTTTRDVAAAQEVRNRGITALGHSVVENVCGLDATGSIGYGIRFWHGTKQKSIIARCWNPLL
ncbi:hypothetical protein IQ238_13985 [Pleurocapsales cyanobacterium LEGE 06147]|nr:hypothetical protein [Pleurocapsales cyanobacterium LEGE 06147]